MNARVRLGVGLFGVALLAASSGCSTPCGNYEAGLNRCGQSFNRSKCDQNISQCTSDDVRTIDNAAACLQNDAVCKGGSTVDGFRVAACELPVASVSSPCRNAFF